MYGPNEKPLFRASICYFDSSYDNSIARAVRDILEQHGYTQPAKFYAGSLTRNRYVNFKQEHRDVFIAAYSKPGIMEVSMASGDCRKADEYWHLTWQFTFEKNIAKIESKFRPWNVLSLDVTYGLIDTPEKFSNYLSCIQKLIAILNPISADLDDVSRKVELLAQANEEHYSPEYIQQIYWGGFWGKNLCNEYGTEFLLSLPLNSIKPYAKGIFYSSGFDSVHSSAGNGHRTQRQAFQQIKTRTLNLRKSDAGKKK